MKVQLLLDRASVADAEGVEFRLNEAAKHPANPVLLPGAPHQWDSLQVSWPATVLYSAEDKRFRCWYSGLDAVQTPGRFWKPGYAESEDGVHWRKPEIGQVTYLDAPTNQLRPDWPWTILSFVFENPERGAPESQRFGSYWTETVPSPDGDRLRKGLAWSPDGREWRRAGTPYGDPARERTAFQDISQLLFDDDDSDPAFRVKGYGQYHGPRPWDGRVVRQIGLVHGERAEAVDDAPDPVILAPEQAIDEELHFASVRRIGDTFLMLFESDRFSTNPIHGDLRLAVGDDGRTFRRVHARQALLNTGGRGMWDENLLVTTSASMQEVGDEIYIFYCGCPAVYNSWPSAYAVAPERRGSLFYPAALGLAVLPRDRFAYAVGPGWVTTRPLTIGADGLWLNAQGDDLQITALCDAGEEMGHGRLTDRRRQTVYREVVWPAGTPAGPCQLRITLGFGNKLFSIAGQA